MVDCRSPDRWHFSAQSRSATSSLGVQTISDYRISSEEPSINEDETISELFSVYKESPKYKRPILQQMEKAETMERWFSLCHEALGEASPERSERKEGPKEPEDLFSIPEEEEEPIGYIRGEKVHVQEATEKSIERLDGKIPVQEAEEKSIEKPCGTFLAKEAAEAEIEIPGDVEADEKAIDEMADLSKDLDEEETLRVFVEEAKEEAIERPGGPPIKAAKSEEFEKIGKDSQECTMDVLDNIEAGRVFIAEAKEEEFEILGGRIHAKGAKEEDIEIPGEVPKAPENLGFVDTSIDKTETMDEGLSDEGVFESKPNEDANVEVEGKASEKDSSVDAKEDLEDTGSFSTEVTEGDVELPEKEGTEQKAESEQLKEAKDYAASEKKHRDEEMERGKDDIVVEGKAESKQTTSKEAHPKRDSDIKPSSKEVLERNKRKLTKIPSKDLATEMRDRSKSIRDRVSSETFRRRKTGIEKVPEKTKKYPERVQKEGKPILSKDSLRRRASNRMDASYSKDKLKKKKTPSEDTEPLLRDESGSEIVGVKDSKYKLKRKGTSSGAELKKEDSKGVLSRHDTDNIERSLKSILKEGKTGALQEKEEPVLMKKRASFANVDPPVEKKAEDLESTLRRESILNVIEAGQSEGAEDDDDEGSLERKNSKSTGIQAELKEKESLMESIIKRDTR
ncbi:hypothetical protein NPIL_73751 [Nephila pilipes]|uniref:Uncharacterized protein n=1 Tax=Nephila pilipes TaxID=299642 RepID=A0A8X6IVP8_NEPPI|nr:hypothetical protein NPIL_73751 [Nephila pilipes]